MNLSLSIHIYIYIYTHIYHCLSDGIGPVGPTGPLRQAASRTGIGTLRLSLLLLSLSLLLLLLLIKSPGIGTLRVLSEH